MKKQLTLLVAALVLIFGFTPAFGADNKIGVIDFERILLESSAGKLGKEQLEKKKTDLTAKIQAEEQNLMNFQKSLEREFMLLSQEKKDEKQREFRIRVNDFNKLKKDMTQEMRAANQSFMAEMEKNVFLIAQELGKKEGYTLIIEKKIGGVIYRPDNIDLTDKVLKSFNEQVAKKAK